MGDGWSGGLEEVMRYRTQSLNPIMLDDFITRSEITA